MPVAFEELILICNFYTIYTIEVIQRKLTAFSTQIHCSAGLSEGVVQLKFNINHCSYITLFCEGNGDLSENLNS